MMPAMQNQTTAQKLRTLREQKGLTQTALAAEIGISRSYVTKIESGSDAPGRETLMAFATFYGVSLDWLTSGAHEYAPASAQDEREAILLKAFRSVPPDEGDLIIQLLLKRSSGEHDA